MLRQLRFFGYFGLSGAIIISLDFKKICAAGY